MLFPSHDPYQTYWDVEAAPLWDWGFDHKIILEEHIKNLDIK